VRIRPSSAPPAFDLEVGYWSGNWEWSATNIEGHFSYRTGRRDLHFGLNVLAETRGPIRFSIGGGLGLFANARYDLLKAEAQNETKLYGGVRLSVAKAAPAPPAEPPLSSRPSDPPHAGSRR
jgi:hypothetical protein